MPEIINKDGAYRTKQPSTRTISNISVFTIHHDAIPQDERTFKELCPFIQNIHFNNWGRGMEYHFYIDKDGTIVQVNDIKYHTYHDKINWNSIGICLNGYFHAPYNDKPTDAQLASLKWLLDKLSTEHPEFPADHNDVYAHREIPSNATACCGDLLFPYVKEYRQKLGVVEWGKPVNTCDEIKEQYEELKVKFENAEKKANYYDEIRELVDVDEDKWSVTKPRIEELVETEKKYIKLEDNYKIVTDANETLSKLTKTQKTQIDELEKQIQGYKQNKYSIPEAITFLLDAIKRKAVKSNV